MKFKDIQFPKTFKYASDRDHKPWEFYANVIPQSTEIDFKLGYFSSYALSILAQPLSLFILKGGVLRLITCHKLNQEDIDLIDIENEEYQTIKDVFSKNPEELESILRNGEQLFRNCLKYLLKNKRLVIQPVFFKQDYGLAHEKVGVFYDGQDYLQIDGSCNLTPAGIFKNGESFRVTRSWSSKEDMESIIEEKSIIRSILEGRNDQYIFVKKDQLETIIKTDGQDKTEDELLEDGKSLLAEFRNIYGNESRIKEVINRNSEERDKLTELIKKTPAFPYAGGPREYQIEAYHSWVANDYKGMFAMATGTGKTLTSLNCVLNEYKKNGFYKFIVLVPTTALAKQWQEEVTINFKFEDTILCCSKNPSWRGELSRIGTNIVLGGTVNYGIITTYATFRGTSFQSIFKETFCKDFNEITLISDEAHNLASPGFLKVLPEYLKLRIGLSATPERQFDENGNSIISKYFNNSQEKYTFEYDMKTAIDNGFLCRYYYYPLIVELEESERKEYFKISRDLVKFIDHKTGKYKDSDYVRDLLIKRKNVIHKANQKIGALVSIVKKIGAENFNNAFVYVPEGYEANYSDSDSPSENDENNRIIDFYTTELYNLFNLKLAKFTGDTSNRDQILKQFTTGKLDALLAMKCLDEGIDIPQTKYAIFCSSTGNPRQYIQRRGRVLRNFKGKDHAVIYDLIVRAKMDHTATDEQLSKMDKSIFLSELRRLVNFAVLSENKDECLHNLESISEELGIDIYDLANKELDNYK